MVNWKTGNESRVTLSSDNPTVEVDGCLITLLGIRQMPGLPDEKTKYVDSSQII